MTSPGQPYTTVTTKRTFDIVPVTFDWHDFLANQRQPGFAVPLDYVWRPLRIIATGLQYRCTQAGVSSPLDTPGIFWPRTVGAVTDDGTAQWTAEPLTIESLRAIIGSYTYTESAVPPGSGAVTSVDAGSEDLVYATLVGAGTSGESYRVKMEIILIDSVTTAATGEKKEAVAVLPVQD